MIAAFGLAQIKGQILPLDPLIFFISFPRHRFSY